MSRRITCSLWMLALMLVAMTVLATGFGALRLPVSLLSRDCDEALRQIWITIRLPRVLLALVIGGSLALAGCVMQGLFRNPLADPGLLGISSGAACAVALWVVLPVSLPALMMLYAPMLAAFFGFGSAKLRGKYNTARRWFTAGVAADNGYNLSEELTTRENTAANILTTASNTLGADSAEVLAAQTALNDFSACLQAVQNGGKSQSLTSLPYYQGSTMHALYQADQALGTAIDQLYAKLQEQAADPMKMGAVQGQYGQFNSAATIIGTLQYNTAVYEYQNEVGGFPASVLGALSGVKEVEPFA